MAVPEPTSELGLWPRVRAYSGWPEPDEDAVRELAAGWRAGATAFAEAGRFNLGGLAGTWPDVAGAAFTTRATATLQASARGAEGMTAIADRADFFADEVTRVKNGIRDLIQTNLGAFAVTETLPPGVREVVQETFVLALAGLVNVLVSDAAGRVSGQPGGWAEAAKEFGGFFKGLWEGAVESAEGLAALPSGIDDAARKLWTDPRGFAEDSWRGLVDPIVEDWNNGNEGEAIGRGVFGLAEAVLGSKGLAKVGHLADVVPDPDAPRPDAPTGGGGSEPGAGGSDPGPGGSASPPNATEQLRNGQEFGGAKLPVYDGPPDGVLYKRNPQTGEITNYTVYDADGHAVKRVDLTGRSHGGVPTPHVVEYDRNVRPSDGQVFVREQRHVRPANPDEIPE
ncbi:WXG100-like domain-containing protein [Plantactinospora sonchi]|uniref:Polymorphic toxin type 24 domain-containing protein n=1 Tax=Plantactinospora sonchi TaxID=1544735 RepID=A0ABU7RNW7_9ACTN